MTGLEDCRSRKTPIGGIAIEGRNGRPTPLRSCVGWRTENDLFALHVATARYAGNNNIRNCVTRKACSKGQTVPWPVYANFRSNSISGPVTQHFNAYLLPRVKT